MGDALRINLVLPELGLGLGAWRWDPIEQAVGQPLAQLLRPLLAEAPSVRPVPSGGRATVYPLALPNGQGGVIPLGDWGEVGLWADQGTLVLALPIGTAGWIRTHLGPYIVHGPHVSSSTHGGLPVLHTWLRLPPGESVTVPLGLLGQARLEAA